LDSRMKLAMRPPNPAPLNPVMYTLNTVITHLLLRVSLYSRMELAMRPPNQ
jgi:hypothetical protein